MSKKKLLVFAHSLLCVFISIVCTSKGFAQDYNLPNKVSIASPTAAALGKYGDIPISYHTGLPSINIPVYSVSEGPLQLPIGLSYHASGLKVMELASFVGAGWSLNAGGVITRSVNGAPDDRGFGSVSNVTHGHFTNYGFNNYLFTNTQSGNGPPGTSPNNKEADDASFMNGLKDGEPDLFFFNFNGYSGKFYFRDDRTPVLVPETDLKIEPYLPGTIYIQGFIITTPDGVKYYFGKNQLQDGSIDAVEVTSTYTVEDGLTNGTAISSWYLNRMVSPDSKFSIKLIYLEENYSYYTISMFPVPSTASSPDDKGFTLIKNFVKGVRLNKIKYSNGTINFLPGATRTDLGGSEAQFPGIEDSVNTEAKTLGSIQITDSFAHCKEFKLYYSYFTDNSTSVSSELTNIYPINTDKKRLRLDSIQERSCDSVQKIPPYSFTYTTPANDSVFAPRRLTFAQDHWGFYNGQTSNARLIPTYTVNDFTTVSGANRESSWPEMSYGSLKKIKYPTGGNTQFVFEPNDVWLNFTYYSQTSRATAGIGPGIGQSQTQTVNITTTANPYKLMLDFHTNMSYTSTGAGYFGGLTVDRDHPHAEIIIQPGAGSQTYYLSQNNMALQSSDWASAAIYEEVPGNYQDNKIVGGLRINKIFNTDEVTATSDTTFYTYRSGVQSSGILYSRPTYVQVMRNDIVKQVGYINPGYEICSPNGCVSCDIGLIYSRSPGSLRPMNTSQGNHIGYNSVTVSKTGNGYTSYRYYGSDVWDTDQSDVCIRNVNLTCSSSIPNFPAAPLPFEFKRGELKYEGQYTQGGQLLKESTYYPVFVNSPISTPAYLTSYWGITLYDLTTAKKTKMTVVSNYYQSPGVSLTTIDSSFYESPYHSQLTRKVTLNSTGDRLETKFKYANDFRVANCDTISDCFTNLASSASSATSTFNYQLYSCTSSGSWNCKWLAFQQYRRDLSIARINYVSCRRSNFADSVNVFKTNHTSAKTSADTELKPILELQDQFQNPAIEVTNWKRNLLASAGFNKYAVTGSDVYVSKSQAVNLAILSSTFTNAVATITSVTKDSRYKDESFVQFDNGNIIEVKKKDGVSTSYIWDYNNSAPIAQVVNATSPDIAYSSFEADGKGSWSFSGTPGVDYTGPTGKKIYTLTGSNNITKSGLSSGKTYIVSYWRKSTSALSITGTASGYPTAGRTIDGWKYFEHHITGQTSVTITGSGSIDELRLYPLSAQMSTFTFEPLIGVSSQCDPNNKISYYEYDKLGRLSIVKDQNRDVIKRVCYNFFGQVENCSSGYFANVLKTGSYTRNNCGAGYAGSTVIDTVAAGVYNSPISQTYVDSLAQADVNANGQGNANVKGTCTFVCDSTSCSGVDKKCVNGICETGVKVYIASTYSSRNNNWSCIWVYQFSDCSTSAGGFEIHASSCTVTTCP
jgi:hypothetical protein